MNGLTSARAIGDLLVERQARLVVEALVIGVVLTESRRSHLYGRASRSRRSADARHRPQPRVLSQRRRVTIHGPRDPPGFGLDSQRAGVHQRLHRRGGGGATSDSRLRDATRSRVYIGGRATCLVLSPLSKRVSRREMRLRYRGLQGHVRAHISGEASERKIYPPRGL